MCVREREKGRERERETKGERGGGETVGGDEEKWGFLRLFVSTYLFVFILFVVVVAVVYF